MPPGGNLAYATCVRSEPGLRELSAEQFTAAGVRPDARAEQLEVAEFVALANAS